MKITGGSLSTREIINEEKVNQIRLYSGDKFESVREAPVGTVCAVLGLTIAVPGQGLGTQSASAMPLLEPVMTYRILPPEGLDAAAVLPKFRELEEEDSGAASDVGGEQRRRSMSDYGRDSDGDFKEPDCGTFWDCSNLAIGVLFTRRQS